MVEDEEQVLNTNYRMLRRRGYDVRTAQTVSEVCHQLEEQLPDLLILDIMLPDGNGLDICRHFREKTMNPVLFLTGKSDIRDKVEGLQQGGDYYLTKPYNFDEFLAVIQMLLERQKRIEEKIKENFNNELKNQPVIENNQYSGETLSNQEEKIESSAQEEKSYNDYDFLKMYEKNFGLAVKPQEEKEKIDVSSEFKPTTGEENLSVFGNNEEFSVKPVYKYIGIAFENYFVIEMQDSLYIIDQKKANERIVYENIKNNYYSNNRNSQLMLLPDIVTLTYRQMGIYKDNREMFEKAGFSIEEFGENTLKISGVPEIIVDLETKDIFLDTLEEINTVARTAKQEIEEKFIRCLAKNSANQEKKIQNAQEAVALLDKLLVLPEPFDVTEGSTSAIKMTKADIEKKFSRRK